MKYLMTAFFIVMSQMFTGSFAKTIDDSIVSHIEYPDWFYDNPFLDLTEGLEQADAEGKAGLMVVFTTEGCSYCNLFISKSLNDPEISGMVRKNFITAGLEIFDDVEMTTPAGEIMAIKQFAKQQKVEFSPSILFFAKNGKRIASLVGYQSPERFRKVLQYLTLKQQQKSRSLTAFLDESGKTSAKALTPTRDRLFSRPPYMLDRSRIAARHPLLLIFEQAECEACEELHTEVLTDKTIRKKLRNFEIIQLDKNDSKTPVLSPDGHRTTPKELYRNAAFSRTPAMLFYDKSGNEVLKTDALVLHQRLTNSLDFVLQEAFKKGWSYQRFARSQALKRVAAKKGSSSDSVVRENEL